MQARRSMLSGQFLIIRLEYEWFCMLIGLTRFTWPTEELVLTRLSARMNVQMNEYSFGHYEHASLRLLLSNRAVESKLKRHAVDAVQNDKNSNIWLGNRYNSDLSAKKSSRTRQDNQVQWLDLYLKWLLFENLLQARCGQYPPPGQCERERKRTKENQFGNSLNC